MVINQRLIIAAILVVLVLVLVYLWTSKREGAHAPYNYGISLDQITSDSNRINDFIINVNPSSLVSPKYDLTVLSLTGEAVGQCNKWVNLDIHRSNGGPNQASQYIAFIDSKNDQVIALFSNIKGKLHLSSSHIPSGYVSKIIPSVSESSPSSICNV